jgi:hypothetical protein
MDVRSQQILQSIIRREGRSLLQYVADAFPWTTDGQAGALATVKRFTDEEQEAIAGLVRFLTEQRVTPPYLGAFPSAFTNINFTALEFLLPRLVEAQRQLIAELRRDMSQVSDQEALALLNQLLQMKEQHLAVLESLNRNQPAAAAAS